MNRLPGIFLSAIGLLTIALVAFSFVNRQTSALPEDQSISVDPYHGLAIAGAFEVEVTKGAQGPVQLSGNNLDNVEVKVKDGILMIGCEKNCGEVDVKITVPDLDRIDIAGSGKVHSKGALGSGKGLYMAISGSGQIETNVDADRVKAHISGSGEIECAGSAQTTIVNIAGSGHFDGSALKSRDAQVELSGSGKTEVFASESAKADVSGSGKVMVHGNPAEFKHSVSGSGKVERK